MSNLVICTVPDGGLGARTSADIVMTKVESHLYTEHRADSRFAPSQWETLLQSNVLSHCLGANLESTLRTGSFRINFQTYIQ